MTEYTPNASGWPFNERDGRPCLFPTMAVEDRQIVIDYFGPVIAADLYQAILRIRVLAGNWQDRQRVVSLARNRLIEASFFDPAQALTEGERLAGCLAWAIKTHSGQPVDQPNKGIDLVALCLARTTPNVDSA